MTKQQTKTLMIARYGMLECGRNFKGTMSEYCNVCMCIDDEEHRLNVCPKYENANFIKEPQKLNFNTVYKDNINDLKLIISRIANVWNVSNGNGSMITS